MGLQASPAENCTKGPFDIDILLYAPVGTTRKTTNAVGVFLCDSADGHTTAIEHPFAKKSDDRDVSKDPVSFRRAAGGVPRSTLTDRKTVQVG
jgi:hypothetical protein